MGRVSCIVVGQRRPGNSLLGILQLGSRDRREQGTASLSQAPGFLVGQGEEEATCATSNTTGVWGKAGIQDSASGILVLRGNQREGIIGKGSEKGSRMGRHL